MSRWGRLFVTFTLSSLNLPLWSSSTASRELLSQFSTCSGWIFTWERYKYLSRKLAFLLQCEQQRVICRMISCNGGRGGKQVNITRKTNIDILGEKGIVLWPIFYDRIENIFLNKKTVKNLPPVMRGISNKPVIFHKPRFNVGPPSATLHQANIA